MAKVDIAGLLTGVGSAPIDPMSVGGTYEQRALAAGQRASERMLRGFGALTGADVRTTEQKAQQALAQLDPSKREDRKRIIEIVQRVNPERVTALREEFTRRDREEGALKADADKKKSIRDAVVKRLKDDPMYSNVIPLVSAGAFDDNPEELLKLLKQEPAKGVKLTKPFAAQTADGKPLMLTIRSEEGRDDQIVDLEGNPPPLGTVLEKQDGTSVQVSLGEETESAFEKALGTGLAKDAIESRNKAVTSSLTSDVLNNQWKIVGEGIITGTGADIRLSLGKLLVTAGIVSDDENVVANTEAFLANAGALVADVIEAFGSGTGLSDADRKFAQQMAAGTATITEDAIKRILRLQARATQRKIEMHNKRMANLPTAATKYDLTIPVPEFPWAALQPGEPGYTGGATVDDETQKLIDLYTNQNFEKK